jgi:hypothetical protein
MEKTNLSPQGYKILLCLSCLPKKILTLHGAENTTEFVLHTLCGEQCFDFSKAAYFVDNPDFNCCKGVAGCCKTEQYQHPDDAWIDPETFSNHMKDAAFNKKVRQCSHASITNGLESAVKDLAQELEIQEPAYYVWQLKNGNNGILIFERSDKDMHDDIEEHLEHGLSLLGFCPIF